MLNMIKALFIFIFTSMLGVVSAQDEQNLLVEQKRIIAELSGHKKMSNGLMLKSRSSSLERDQTRRYLEKMINKLGLETQIQKYTWPNVNPIVDLLFDPFKGANVYVELPATKKTDEYIIVGAHFDSEMNCPGAIDNGTGIVITYGAIKKLMELSQRKVNVVLVYFDQEEEGLIGSQAFAKKLIDENYSVSSVHTLDAIGWDGDKDQAVDLELPSHHLLSIYRRIGDSIGMSIKGNKISSSDHQSFRDLGFNVTGLTDELSDGDYTPYGDTSDDTYETVNFDYVESSTELLFLVLKELVQK